MAENLEFQLRAAMNPFEAIVAEAIGISAFAGHMRLAAGTYLVPLLHDERGASDGAQLVRIDVEGEPPIRLPREHLQEAGADIAADLANDRALVHQQRRHQR